MQVRDMIYLLSKCDPDDEIVYIVRREKDANGDGEEVLAQSLEQDLLSVYSEGDGWTHIDIVESMNFLDERLAKGKQKEQA